MIRCPNCSSVLPELESQGLTQCPQCQCELAPTGLPPLPGFDLEAEAPATRSPTIFGLTGVGHQESLSTELPLQSSRSHTAPLPGLPSVEDEISLPEIQAAPSRAPKSHAKPQTQSNRAVDFSNDEESGLPALQDLPGLSMDLPGISLEGESLPALSNNLPGLAPDLPSPGGNLPSASLDLPGPAIDLPSPSADLPSPSAELPALSGSLPASMSTSLAPAARANPGTPVLRTQTPPPPPGSARYQRPSAARRGAGASKPASAKSSTPHHNSRTPGGGDPRAMLKRALARNVAEDDDFLPGIEELDLDIAGGPALAAQPSAAPDPQPVAPAANTNAILPEDLPETVAALDLSDLSVAGAALPPGGTQSNTHHGASPAPRAVEQRRRWPLVLGGVFGVLALAGIAGWQLELIPDPFGNESPSASFEDAPLELPGLASGGKDAPRKDIPANRLKPRSKPFVSALYSDEPLNAKTLATAEKDQLGEIEASLYFALQDTDPRGRTQAWAVRANKQLAKWASNPAPFVQRVVGLGYMYQGQHKKAAASFDKADANLKGAHDPLLALYKAILAFEEGRSPKAVEMAQGLALSSPEVRRAELLAQTWSQGLPAFTRMKPNVVAWEGLVAQAVAGDAPASHAYTLADQLVAQGDWSQAQKIASTYVERAKDEQDTQRWQVLRAKVMLAQGQTAASRQLLQEVIEKTPDCAPAYAMLWDSLYEQELYKSLDHSLEARLTRRPDDVAARIMQVRSLAAQGDGSVALLMLAKLDQHIIANAPVGPAVHVTTPNKVFKALAQQAKTVRSEALIKVPKGLANVAPQKRAIAAQSALARGEILARRMAAKAANAAFETALELNPEHPQAAMLQSSMLVKLNQFARAMAVLEGADANLANHPSARANRVRAELLAHSARLARQTGKGKLARRRLAQAQAVDPQNPNIELRRARLMLRSGQERAAEARFAALAARVGDMPGLMTPLSQIYLRRGELDKLDAIITPKLSSDDVSLDMLISGARLRIAQNQLMPALALATRALKDAPNHWEAHLVKSQVLLARGDLKSALAELQTFKPKDPNSKYELWIGKIKDAQGDLEGAYGHFRLASSLDKSSVEPRVLQAKILARRGNAKKAISMLKPILKRRGANADVFLAMGIAHRDLRKPKKAVVFFKRAQSLAPGSYVAFYEEGRIASNHNRHAQVIRSMDRALAANAPAMPTRMRLDALRRLGRAYVETRDFNRAEEVLSRYLIEAPRNDPGRGAVMRMMESL